MNKLSIVLCGTKYKEYSLSYAIDILYKNFPDCEIIVSTNDKNLENDLKKIKIDKIITNDDIGELPSLKFPLMGDEKINNNINKQIQSCRKGIEAATNNLVLKLRTDQVILTDKVIKLWEEIVNIPIPTKKKGRIITSSIFSLNPRYSERMPYHISDMFQLGYKEDLLSYYSAPEYPFEYATWYERTPHDVSSNNFERAFRSRFAVEQWLALHYIFGEEEKFPIAYHNNCNMDIISNFEDTFIDYFIIAHPDDIDLRVSKFASSKSYYNTQCYSTRESLILLSKKYPKFDYLVNKYAYKGMKKKYFDKLMPLIYSKAGQFIIKNTSESSKERIKKILNLLF